MSGKYVETREEKKKKRKETISSTFLGRVVSIHRYMMFCFWVKVDAGELFLIFSIACI